MSNSNYLYDLFAKWEKEIHELSLRMSTITGSWLNTPEVLAIWNKAHELHTAAALLSASSLKYGKFHKGIEDDLREANHFVQKGACGLLHKSLKAYREVQSMWDQHNGQHPPTN